jgi:putative two-component system response regulator
MSALLALSEAIEARDTYTREHSVRVAHMALEVGMRLGCDDARLGLLRLGGTLHDVGKLVVSETILGKPGPLTEEEFAEVRVHPEAGARMVALDRTLRPAFPGVLFHHER